MADTDALKQYTPANPPVLGADRNYLQDELSKVKVSIGLLISVMKKLEARLVVGSL